VLPVQFSLLCTVHFSLPSVSQALKQLYHLCHCTMLRYNFEPKSKGLLKIIIPLCHSILQIHCKHLPITMNNKLIFHNSKLLSLIKIFPWALRCTQLKHVVSNKAGAAEISHSTMQEILLPRKMPNPALQLSNFLRQELLLPRKMLNPALQLSSFLRQLPRAASLESSSHGVTQSKMLTNFLTLSHVNGDWNSYTNHQNYLKPFTN